MVTVAIAWGFLTHKNKYIYEHGVFDPIRRQALLFLVIW